EVGQLHRARLAEIAIPVLLSSVLAAGTALLVVGSVIGGATSDPAAGIQYLVSVAGAYALVIGAVLVSSPLVRRYAVRTAWALRPALPTGTRIGAESRRPTTWARPRCPSVATRSACASKASGAPGARPTPTTCPPARCWRTSTSCPRRTRICSSSAAAAGAAA